jgi:hypothetical protein
LEIVRHANGWHYLKPRLFQDKFENLQEAKEFVQQEHEKAILGFVQVQLPLIIEKSDYEKHTRK